MIVTVEAPSNIAFIKYWGARDLEKAIPENPSISMSLRSCTSICSVRLGAPGEPDRIWLADEAGALTDPGESFSERVLAHLHRLRRRFSRRESFEIATRNSFPSAAGIASSASGFAALTMAVVGALGVEVSAREMSALARSSGSGSASRSTRGGFVEWPHGADEESCYSVALFPASHWQLADLVAVVSSLPKEISSLEGHRRAGTSPYYARRQELLPARLEEVRGALSQKSIGRLGRVLEEEAVDLHLIAMSSTPPIFYWQPGTLEVLAALRRWRLDGIEAYGTMDAGPNVHVICEQETAPEVAQRLRRLGSVEEVIEDGVGEGPRRLDEHLL